EGTAADDTILVDGTTVSINGVAFDYANVASAEIDSLAGNDDIYVTVSDVAISIDGGVPTGSTPSDHLTVDVLGAPTNFEPGPLNDEGVVKATGYEYVSFDNIEGLTIIGAGPAIINGTNGDDMITVIARDASTHVGADGIQDFTSTVNAGLEILWLDAAAATVNALSGNDDIDIVATAPNDADWNVAVTVNGGYGQDDTSVKTLFEHDVIYTPDTINSGLLTIDDTAPSTVQLNDMEEFYYGAQGGDVDLSVEATVAGDLIKYTALTEASGTVQVNNLLAMKFNGMSADGSFTVDGLGGNDTLVYNGTSADDEFDVAATTGAISLSVDGADYVTVEQTGVEDIIIRGQDGDDTFTLNGPTGYATVKLDGGLPSASDLAIINGTDADEDIIIDVGSGIVVGTGDLVLLTSVEHVNVNAGNGADDVLVTKLYDSAGGGITEVGVDLGDGDDSIVVENLVGSTVRVVGVATGDGDDDIAINGTNNNDSIAAEVSDGRIVVSGLAATVVISESASDSDMLTIYGFAGDDSIVANNGVEGLIDVTINGGAGADYIFGNGTLNGDAGDDRIEIGLGASVVNGGTGCNVVISQGNVNFTLSNTNLVGSGTATLTNIQQAELDGCLGNNTFDIGAFTGDVTITGGGGSDTVDFSESDSGVNVDLDKQDIFQSVNTNGLHVMFTDLIANIIGSEFNDTIWVSCLPMGRNVDGNGSDTVPTGDILFVDAHNRMATVDHMVGGVPVPDAGTVYVVNSGVVTFDNIPTLNTLNNTAATGFNGGVDGMLAYTTSVNYTSGGTNPGAIAVGDLNGDGYADMVVTTTGPRPRMINVLLNNGYGIMSAPTSYATPSVRRMYDIHLADVDGDGDLDIVSAGSLSRLVTVITLLNNGDGTFSAPIYSQTNVRSNLGVVASAVGNIDGDNALEVIVGNSRRIEVMDNAGGGAFVQDAVVLTGARTLRQIQMVDTDGDGIMDLMAIPNKVPSTVSILRNPGADGNWVLNSVVRVNKVPTSVAMADFNADGLYEIAVSNCSSNVFTVLASSAYTNWYIQSQPVFSELRTARSRAITAADINGDGKMDLLLASSKYRSVVTMLANGNGTFSDPQAFSTGTLGKWQPTAIAVADFNGDGGLDIAVANALTNNISILLKNPT
ncbi:MAG: VCBS repeat-containing protein, partial [Planctomycetaceae bacterium]